MAKRISAYKCSDGTIFENSIDANKHDALLQFKDWYENHRLYGNCDGCKIDAKEMIDWLIDNKASVIYLYGLDTTTEQSA